MILESIRGYVVVSIEPISLCSKGPRSCFWAENNSVQSLGTSQKFWLSSAFKVFFSAWSEIHIAWQILSYS